MKSTLQPKNCWKVNHEEHEGEKILNPNIEILNKFKSSKSKFPKLKGYSFIRFCFEHWII
jgi:hypothetical protein